MLLDEIKKENDIKNIPVEELPKLAGEIRTFLQMTGSIPSRLSGSILQDMT